MSYSASQTDPFDEHSQANCFGCGRSFAQIQDMPRHGPEPDAAAEDRCESRPRKYTHLRCMYAAGHECVHTAKVVGTGLHFWPDDLAA